MGVAEFISFFLGFGSMTMLVGSVGMLFFIVFKYFRGMDKPPFWIFLIGGFFLSFFYTILITKLPNPEVYRMPTDIVKFMSHLMIFMGVFELYKAVRKKPPK